MTSKPSPKSKSKLKSKSKSTLQSKQHSRQHSAPKPMSREGSRANKKRGQKKFGNSDSVKISQKSFAAVLFDMDGVVTKTAAVHTKAWKQIFDDFLRKTYGDGFKPFSETDYLNYVDGKPREDGVASFLKSRKIKLPMGTAKDKAGFSSIYALGNLKNKRFRQILKKDGVEVYETTIGLIRSLKSQGIKTAVITASKNADSVLKEANLSHIFDAKIDGVDAAKLKLPGKPKPDTYLAAAKKLGVKPAKAVVIEDAASGVEAGKKGHFGLVIGVARTNDSSLLKKHGADVVVRDLGAVELEHDGVAARSYRPSRDAADNTMDHPPGTALADLDITDKNWVLTYHHFKPKREGQRESLCAVGNGYFCTRAAAPESTADDVHYPGTYIAGAYNRLKTKVKNVTVENEEIVNMPNWLSVTFCIKDGDWFALKDVEILNYQQKLNLFEGIVYRRVHFRDKQNRETTLSQKWFVHMANPHLAGIETKIKAHNWSGKLTIASAIDGRIVNDGTIKNPRAGRKHLKPAESKAKDNVLFLKMYTSQSQIIVAMAARHKLKVQNRATKVADKYSAKPDLVRQEMTFSLARGGTATLQKVVALHTSRDLAIAEAGRATQATLKEAASFTRLVAEQKAAWRKLWRQFDLFIETTQAHSKIVPSLLVHLNSFHALQTASPNTIDLDTGVPARGWTGEGYQGHIFWDDLFIFPFINMRMPNITRSLLKYRHRRLGEARQLALKKGAKGACFPWQSGSSGREETPDFVWIAEKKIWAEDHTHLEIHVNAAIAYNIWQFYQVTASLDFMHQYGAEMFFEITRFFATFAKHNKKEDRYEIHNVIGPDEYHNGYPGKAGRGINNNAYTNVMAAWIFDTALQLLDVMPADYRAELVERLEISEEETALWLKMSKRMYVPFMKKGLINQFDGWEKLDEFPTLKDGRLDLMQLKKTLQEQGLVLNSFKVSKQADVLMLFYVFSAQELEEIFARLGYNFKHQDIPQNIDYYMRRTANMSTLSRIAITWILARLDRCRSWQLIQQKAANGSTSNGAPVNGSRTNVSPANGSSAIGAVASGSPVKGPTSDALADATIPHSWNIFMEALESDFLDTEEGSTREGLHMGAIAGTLDIVQRCYAGIVTRNNILWFAPQLPDALTRLSFNLHYRDHALALDITHQMLKITVGHSSAEKIKIGFGKRVYLLNEGETRTFRLSREEAPTNQMHSLSGHAA